LPTTVFTPSGAPESLPTTVFTPSGTPERLPTTVFTPSGAPESLPTIVLPQSGAPDGLPTIVLPQSGTPDGLPAFALPQISALERLPAFFRYMLFISYRYRYHHYLCSKEKRILKCNIMKQFLWFICIGVWLTGCDGKEEKQAFKMIDTVDFSHVKITDGFWAPRLANHATTTLAVCIDQIENQTGRIRNFEHAAKGTGEHSGIFFDDSDVYKALEGIAYTLKNNPNPDLEKKADEWIDKFAAAQQADGYINTFYTLTGLEKRWSNMDKHEMYCAGHMIEAGTIAKPER
jgi:hypothetical protein